MQDGATSHTANITQQYLKVRFGRRFIRKDQWPPNSPDCSPLDYFFWDAVKRKVYEGRRERFSSLDELKKRIQRVWKDACDVETLRKAIMQFRPRLKAVVKENCGPDSFWVDIFTRKTLKLLFSVVLYYFFELTILRMFQLYFIISFLWYFIIVIIYNKKSHFSQMNKLFLGP